jgi:hypothetical protein
MQSLVRLAALLSRQTNGAPCGGGPAAVPDSGSNGERLDGISGSLLAASERS